MRRRYLVQGMCYVVGALRNVQCEYLARIDDKRDHARSDEYRDENRGDRIEAGPAIELDEECRYNHTDRTERVLSMAPSPQTSVSRSENRVDGNETHGHDV